VSFSLFFFQSPSLQIPFHTACAFASYFKSSTSLYPPLHPHPSPEVFSCSLPQRRTFPFFSKIRVSVLLPGAKEFFFFFNLGIHEMARNPPYNFAEKLFLSPPSRDPRYSFVFLTPSLLRSASPFKLLNQTLIHVTPNRKVQLGPSFMDVFKPNPLCS